MPGCSVKTCKNWNGKTKHLNIRYFTFPKEEEVQKVWLNACGREKLNLKHARICSVHFEDSCYTRKSKHRRLPSTLSCPNAELKKLLPGAVPTKFIVQQNEVNETCAPIAIDSDISSFVSLSCPDAESKKLLTDAVPTKFIVQQNEVNETCAPKAIDSDISSLDPVSNDSDDPIQDNENERCGDKTHNVDTPKKQGITIFFDESTDAYNISIPKEIFQRLVRTNTYMKFTDLSEKIKES